MKPLSDNEKYCFWLSTARGISELKFYNILEYFVDLENVFNNVSILKQLNIDEEVITGLKKRAKISKINEEIEHLLDNKIYVSTILSDNYPRLLKEITTPPPILYVKGDLERITDKCFSIVGTRRPTRNGVSNTRSIAKGLAENGVTIVSGMARGIDTAAHLGALDAGGITIAVLGGGIDVIYPPENDGIYRDICETGAIISEFAPGTEPYSFNFPIRNRIISGISSGLLVAQAKMKSGTQLTVEHALDQSRDIFAMPGDINYAQSEFPNSLIKQGSEIVCSYNDILEYYSWKNETKSLNLDEKNENTVANLDFLGKSIYNLLMQGDLTSQEIIEEVNADSADVMTALTLLEIENLIVKLPGNLFGINK